MTVRRVVTVAFGYLGILIAGGAVGSLGAVILQRASEGSITAYATVFLGAVTAVLSGYTAMLAFESRASRRLADQHHQESLNPLLSMLSVEAFHTADYEGLRFKDGLPPDAPLSHFVHAKVQLHNVGFGPAIRVEYRAQFTTDEGVFSLPSDNPDDWSGLGTVSIGGVVTADPKRSYGPEVRGVVDSIRKSVAFTMEVRYHTAFGGVGGLSIYYDDKNNYRAVEKQPGAVTRALLS